MEWREMLSEKTHMDTVNDQLRPDNPITDQPTFSEKPVNIETSKLVEPALDSKEIVRLYPEGYCRINIMTLIWCYAGGGVMCCLAILYWISEHSSYKTGQDPIMPFLFLGGIGFFLFYLGVKLNISRNQQIQQLRIFKDNSVKNQGRIIDRWKFGRSYKEDNTVTVYCIAIQFNIRESNFTLLAEVSHKIWLKFKQGKNISIIYSDQNPQIALIEGEYERLR